MNRVSSGERWIILRTAAAATLRLEASLAEDGFEVWTPARVERRWITRANAKRDVRLPLTPRFVFARERHEHELLELAAMLERPRRGIGRGQPAHPSFSVFRSNDEIGKVEDAELEPLRLAGSLIVPDRSRHFRPDDPVRVPHGSFGGMCGIVRRGGSKFTLVCFDNGFEVEVATFILVDDDGKAMAA